VPIVVYPKGFTQMPADEVATAATGAVDAWSEPMAACSYLELSLAVSDDPSPVAIPLPHGAVVFREKNWCWLLEDGSCSTAPRDVAAHQSNTLMLTTIASNTRTGEIVMAATEVNAFYVRWADLAAHPEMQTDPPTIHDLQNALTHELGHFIGLDHNCVAGDPFPWPKDGTGNHAVSCVAADDTIREATMFFMSNPGDLEKRTLAADDVAGLCGVYPIANDPKKCTPPDGMIHVHLKKSGCGCDVAPTPGGIAALVVLAALSLASRRRAPFC
jgi:MYXO-CTERM domain-containing protein